MAEPVQTHDIATRRERATRSRASMLAAAANCIDRAITDLAPDAEATTRLFLSDDVFRQLHGCVQEHARALRALGEPCDRAAALVREAAHEAAAGREVHPALLAAIGDWATAVYDEKAG